MNLYRVGHPGDDRIVSAATREQAIHKANNQARSEHEQWRFKHGNAPPADRYDTARELKLVDGVESRRD